MNPRAAERFLHRWTLTLSGLANDHAIPLTLLAAVVWSDRQHPHRPDPHGWLRRPTSLLHTVTSWHLTGLDLHEPANAMALAARQLAALKAACGEWGVALAVYYRGGVYHGGLDALFDTETCQYVDQVRKAAEFLTCEVGPAVGLGDGVISAAGPSPRRTGGEAA